mmetsp:Transcript_33919/g.33032  ORF Transcript_33919/g.33032 Transcript_33919/m.33032 type:complete len:354 (-) Transcript_33919:1374-2435(-)
MARQQMHHFAEGHALVVVGVDHLEHVHDFFFPAGVVLDHEHPLDELSELLLVDHPVVVSVHLLEQLSEPEQKLLMLLQLKVQDGLLEVLEGDLGVAVFALVQQDQLLSGHLLLGRRQQRLLALSHQVFGVAHAHSDALLSVFDDFYEAAHEDLEVLGVVHLLDDLLPHPLLHQAPIPVLDALHHLPNLRLTFERVLVFEEHLEQLDQRVFHVQLDEPELLIALVLQDLPEQRHIMVFPQISLYPVDDGSGPLDDQVLEAVPLVQVSVHVLLHCFPGQLVLLTLLIELHLLRVDVLDDIFQLLEGQHSLLGLPDGSCHLLPLLTSQSAVLFVRRRHILYLGGTVLPLGLLLRAG